MKSFALVAFSFFLATAHASSWITTKCSNSDGSVKWETGGQDRDLIHLKYSNFIEGVLSLEIEKVSIILSKEVTLREKHFKDCRLEAKGRVFAGKVRIVGSEKHPHVLRSQFPENRVQTEVICTTVQTRQNDCIEI